MTRTWMPWGYLKKEPESFLIAFQNKYIRICYTTMKQRERERENMRQKERERTRMRKKSERAREDMDNVELAETVNYYLIFSLV